MECSTHTPCMCLCALLACVCVCMPVSCACMRALMTFNAKSIVKTAWCLCCVLFSRYLLLAHWFILRELKTHYPSDFVHTQTAVCIFCTLCLSLSLSPRSFLARSIPHNLLFSFLPRNHIVTSCTLASTLCAKCECVCALCACAIVYWIFTIQIHRIR